MYSTNFTLPVSTQLVLVIPQQNQSIIKYKYIYLLTII